MAICSGWNENLKPLVLDIFVGYISCINKHGSIRAGLLVFLVDEGC